MASTTRDEISRLELLHAAHPDGLVFPHLADAYRRAGRYSQADEVLAHGLQRHADYSAGHVVLGRLRLDQGRHNEAAEAFETVLEVEPENHVALEYLGRICLEQGRLEEALIRFQRLASLKPTQDVKERIEALERRVRQERRRAGLPPELPEPAEPPAQLERPRIVLSSDWTEARAGQRPPPATPPETLAGEPPETLAGEPPETLAGEPPETPAGEPPETPAQEPPREPAGEPPGERPGEPPGKLAPQQTPAQRRPAKVEAADSGSDGLEPSEVMTETMAELYSRQSLHHRAAMLYRQLLARNPADERLRAKLRAAERAAAGDPQRLAEPEEHAAGAAETGATEAGATEASATEAGGEAGAETAEVEADRSEALEPEQSGAEASQIRAQLQNMLGWQPRDEASARPEPGIRAGERASPVPAGPAVPAAEAQAEPEPESIEPGRPARTLIALTDMLVGVLEYRDEALRGRTSLTRLVAENMARELGTSPADQSAVALAALLRNIGRVAEGPPHEAAGPDTRAQLQRQLNRTLELLDGTGVPTAVRLAVQHRHERWDGTGYPDGLAGNAIPRLARVLAVADSFAAMISPPTGQRALSVRKASQRLLESSGLQHDPTVVRALVRLLDRKDQPLRVYVDRPRILLIEPEPGAVLTTTKLDSSGYRVEVVADPEAARNRLVWFDPAAVVASTRVGERPVADLVRSIRSDKRFRNLAVVVVDASSVAFRVWLLEQGADVCFPPGTTHAEIQGTLAALVRRGTSSRRNDSDG